MRERGLEARAFSGLVCADGSRGEQSPSP
jgi:hypothetical protein